MPRKTNVKAKVRQNKPLTINVDKKEYIEEYIFTNKPYSSYGT